MSTQPISHLRIVTAEQEGIDFSSAQSILNKLTNKIQQTKEILNIGKFSTFDAYIRRIISILAPLFCLILYFLSKDDIITVLISTNKTIALISGIILVFGSAMNFYDTKGQFKKLRAIRNINLKQKEFFSIIIPLSNDIQSLQNAVDASHLLIEDKTLTSWQKVDLGIQILAAEEALMQGREILQKYDPSLLPQ